MATVAELKARLARLEQLIDSNLAEVARLTREQESIQDQRRKLYAGGDKEGAAVLRQQEAAIDDKIAALQSQYQDEAASLRRQIETLETQQAQAAAPQPAPPKTASQTAQDDASKGPNATPTQEVGTDGRVTNRNTAAPTNADKPPVDQPGSPGETTGTDAPVKTGAQTQAVNTDSNSGNAVRAPAAKDSPETASPTSAPTSPGQSAQDDAATKTPTQEAAKAADQASFRVVTQPNVLDQFHSYTYSASVYLLSSEQYRRLVRTKSKRIDGYQLLFQSGGAPNNAFGERPQVPPAAAPDKNGKEAPVPEATGPEDGRNPFFPNDFYIDSITLKTLMAGKGTGSSHQASELKFTVIEPNGITLLDCLRQAVANAAPKGDNGGTNWSAAQYLMVIRFYGYDEEGNLVSPIKGSVVDQDGDRTDPTAVVEKFIPFLIKNLKWSVGSRMVSYEWDCAPTDIMIGGHTARGTIPYDVQLVDSTVGGLLGGDVLFAGAAVDQNDGSNDRAEAAKLARQGARPPSNGLAFSNGSSNPNLDNSAARRANRAGDPDGSIKRAEDAKFGRQAAAAKAPAKADAAPSGYSTNTITQGLCGAMNKFQAELVKKGIYTYPDNYSIRFEDGVDGTPGSAISGAKLQLPNTKVDKAKTASGAAPSQAGGKALDPSRNAVSNVTRVFSITAGMQMLQAIDLVIRNSSYISGQSLVTVNADGTQEPRPENQNKKMKWFTVSMEAEPTTLQDPLRNDYAYNITYVVRPYVLQNFESRYFPRGDFAGIHKSYPYWFTGENTAVLDYQENLNAMYHLTVGAADAKTAENKRKTEFLTSDAGEILKYMYSPRSGESSQGADGKEFEPNANAAEKLNSPSDLSTATVKIVGDPAWIPQGNEFVDLSNPRVLQKIRETGFEPDGSMSFGTADIMFEMVWQRPQDYDLDSGLADPFSKSKVQGNRKGIQSRVYQVKDVTSEFRQGRFEQTITGPLKEFQIPGKTNKPDYSKKEDQSAAETNRLKAANEKAKGRSSGLTDQQAQQARADFAARDPRRLDSSDGGKAAIIGATGGSPAAPGATTVFQSDPRQATILRNTTPGPVDPKTLLPAGAPRPASSGANSGAVGTVAENVGSAPPKMPAAGPGENTLTPEQRRQVAQAGEDARRAFLAQQEAKKEQRLAASGAPVSSSIPSNQKIAKDY